MKLSVLVPSHRIGLSACSRILAACSWASDDIEVIVRDNSACGEKRSFLSQIKADNCRIILADDCGGYENMMAVLEAARGDFVFLAADDDLCGTRSIDAVLSTIKQCEGDESVVGITGHYLFENSSGTHQVQFGQVDSASAIERINGYLANGHSLLYYSALRRTTWLAVTHLGHSLPFRASYLDQIMTMMTLLSGRYIDINRLIYIYDNAGWDGALGHENDYSFYAAAGIGRPILWLHWLFCAFEGTKIILSDLVGKNLRVNERLAAASSWYATMHSRLRASVPYEPQTALDELAVQLRTKWLEARSVSLDALLDDLSDLLLMVCDDKTKALRFREFWSAIKPASN